MSKIFESPDGGNTVYSRDIGQAPGERKLVDHSRPDSRTEDGRPLHEHLMESKLWGNIRRAARTDPALQAELDRVIMFYYLSVKK
jgi:hypothetical protein